MGGDVPHASPSLRAKNSAQARKKILNLCSTYHQYVIHSVGRASLSRMGRVDERGRVNSLEESLPSLDLPLLQSTLLPSPSDQLSLPTAPNPRFPSLVLLLEPILTRLAVVTSIDEPRSLERERTLEVREEIERGHGSSREEVGRHPAAVVFKVVSKIIKLVRYQSRRGRRTYGVSL